MESDQLSTPLNMRVSLNRRNYLFDYIHPCLEKNFMKLGSDGKLGIIPVPLNKITYEDNLLFGKYAYNFRIQIPYAGKTLDWEVLFNPKDLTFAPDFYFQDEEFFPCLGIREISERNPYLASWDVKNPDSLQEVLKEFLNMYREFQVQELGNHASYSKIYAEYLLLPTVASIPEKNIEVLITTSLINFAISIPVDFSNVPEYTQRVKDDGTLLNPKRDFALVLVTFEEFEIPFLNVNLQLSPRLDQLIGSSNKLRSTKFDKDSSLVEYVVSISTIIQGEVDAYAKKQYCKKKIILSLVAMRNKSLIEYDASNFSKIAFLCEIRGYHAMVQVTIGNDFPTEIPVLKVSSLYCMNPKNKQPCEKIFHLKDLPLEDPSEAARVILQRISEHLSQFQGHSHTVTPRSQ